MRTRLEPWACCYEHARSLFVASWETNKRVLRHMCGRRCAGTCALLRLPSINVSRRGLPRSNNRYIDITDACGKDRVYGIMLCNRSVQRLVYAAYGRGSRPLTCGRLRCGTSKSWLEGALHSTADRRFTHASWWALLIGFRRAFVSTLAHIARTCSQLRPDGAPHSPLPILATSRPYHRHTPSRPCSLSTRTRATRRTTLERNGRVSWGGWACSTV